MKKAVTLVLISLSTMLIACSGKKVDVPDYVTGTSIKTVGANSAQKVEASEYCSVINVLNTQSTLVIELDEKSDYKFAEGGRQIVKNGEVVATIESDFPKSFESLKTELEVGADTQDYKRVYCDSGNLLDGKEYLIAEYIDEHYDIYTANIDVDETIGLWIDSEKISELKEIIRNITVRNVR